MMPPRRATTLQALLALLLCSALILAQATPSTDAAPAASIAAPAAPTTSARAVPAAVSVGDETEVEVFDAEDEPAVSSSGSSASSSAGSAEPYQREEMTREERNAAKIAYMEAKRAQPIEPGTPVNLNQADFCTACYTVVEEFQKYTVSNFVDPSARRNQTMTRSEMVEWFCKNGPFLHWKQEIVFGCIKTVQDHHDAVLAPFLGTHTSQEYTTLSKLFQHRVSVCASPEVDACKAWVPERRSSSDCESCTRLMGDLAWTLNREVKINATYALGNLRSLCMEVGMRHDKPMEVEAFCHEHVDEHWNDLQKIIVKVYNDPDQHDKEVALRKRFCGVVTEVCEDDRKSMADEAAKKKEAERKARIAAREAKKVGAGKEKKEQAAAAAKEADAIKDEL